MPKAMNRSRDGNGVWRRALLMRRDKRITDPVRRRESVMGTVLSLT